MAPPENEHDVHNLFFRMEIVEREVDELKDVVRQQMASDAEFRRTLEKAMFELMAKLGDTNTKLEQVVEQMKPMVEDYRERAYGKSYIKNFLADAKVLAVLLVGAVVLLAVEHLPKFFPFIK